MSGVRNLTLRLSVDVLNEDQLIMFFVVDELVDDLRSQHYPKSARPQAQLLTSLHMAGWLAGRISECGVSDIFDVEAIAGVFDRVQDRALQVNVLDLDSL